MRLAPVPFLVVPLLCPLAALAQHEGHFMPDGTYMLNDSTLHKSMDHSTMDHGEILMEPLGSGTGWLPEGSPVHDHAVHFSAGDWMFMTHGELIGRFTGQNLNNADRWPPPPSATAGQSLNPQGERGGTNLDMPNWAMVSAERGLFGDGRLMLRAMMSLDPLTIGDEGYPLLFQTGEGLVDRQHPHDLFMELALLYAHPTGENSRVFAYLGLPGEPALGPTAFMHRPSAGNNPEAPLGHHFQDATHITYGVATAGWIYRRFKAEVSGFRGQEPDAARWNIETGAFDSYSLRLTQSFGEYSAQASAARIHDPEPGEHGEVTRVTASLARNRRLFGGDCASTFAYGMNAGHHGGVLNSFLKETSISRPRGAIWTRVEVLQRVGGELDLPAPDSGGTFWISAVTLGAGGTVFKAAGLDFFLGGQASMNLVETELEDYYGSVPLSAQIFLKVRPSGTKGM